MRQTGDSCSALKWPFEGWWKEGQVVWGHLQRSTEHEAEWENKEKSKEIGKKWHPGFKADIVPQFRKLAPWV